MSEINEKHNQIAPATDGHTGNHVPQSSGAPTNADREKSHDESHLGVKEKIAEKKQKAKEHKEPAGGFDGTPVPSAPDGYTIKFTFHRASNLPLADLAARSSDPYIHATLTSPGISKRHKSDPEVTLRTKTVHRSLEPEWNQVWTVAGIPSSGFKLKCRIYDEDPADHDDRLGNVTINQGSIASWKGLHEDEFDIKKRMGSKRAYAIRGCASLCSSVSMDGSLVISAEVLGKSDPPHGRMYTLGDVAWTKHFSPMIGRLAGTKNFEHAEDGKPKTERYDFQANQFQLQGPVPPELYHRFVEFKGFVKGMFSKKGIRGRILNHALHHQHARIYNYSASTKCGTVKPRSDEASLKFLDMAHYDEGGRIYTYVITLDGLFRFTETGKEFGIDLLSKHTMHSDVNVYIACSGEFFIRRLKHPKKPVDAPEQATHPAQDLPGGPPGEKPPRNAESYELVIDNDSGTYRPKGDLLPKLKEFLEANFPGLHIVTKECTDDKLTKWKDQQREIKKKQGKTVQVVQGDSSDSVSSSDEERLDDMANGSKGGRRKRTGKQKALDVLEDPKHGIKGLIPGAQGRADREEREEREDVAAEGGRS